MKGGGYPPLVAAGGLTLLKRLSSPRESSWSRSSPKRVGLPSGTDTLQVDIEPPKRLGQGAFRYVEQIRERFGLRVGGIRWSVGYR